ncbi:hypothetical protein [Lysinibacillus sp. BW-2-10]|uniref:hypothetical protein n=1 Tax=Lysinibacillus sp. BW-2-10 TaxID=2590030 RepID=UPI00117E9A73|nr:hypothetical protein [Lysinibacillus sp. BW-2-10]TSI07386.1 hypothetical protein FJQ64_08780 [Lysinibacillus sp. BW-2-10]
MKAIKNTLLTTATVIVGLALLLGGSFKVLAAGMHGHGPRAFGHPAMHGHHYMGFPWFETFVVLIIGVIVLVFLMKWLNKKTKDSSMEQFIHTSLDTSYGPMKNQNEDILDQWEKTINNKEKE